MLNQIVSNIGSGLFQYTHDNASGNWPGALAVFVVNNDLGIKTGSVWSSGFTIASGQTQKLPPSRNFAFRKELWIYNHSNNTLYIGQSGINVNTGFPILSAQCHKIPLAGTVDIYGFAPTNDINVVTFEIS